MQILTLLDESRLGLEVDYVCYEQGSRTLSCAIVGVGVKGGGNSSQGPADGLKKYGSLNLVGGKWLRSCWLPTVDYEAGLRLRVLRRGPEKTGATGQEGVAYRVRANRYLTFSRKYLTSTAHKRCYLCTSIRDQGSLAESEASPGSWCGPLVEAATCPFGQNSN